MSTTHLDQPPGRFPAASLAAVLLCVAAFSIVFYTPFLERLSRLEHWTADWRTALLADSVPGLYDKLAVVTFNPGTFGGNTVSPIPRDLHAGVIRILDEMHPRVIGVALYFAHQQDEQKDQAFISAVTGAKTPIVLGAVDAHTREFNEAQRDYQARFLAQTGKPAGFLSFLATKYEGANVVRVTAPALPGSPFQDSFDGLVAKTALAQTNGGSDIPQSTRVAWLSGGESNLEPFTIIPAQDLLSPSSREALEALKSKIAGRVVLTGIDMPNSDKHNTALTVYAGTAMRGLLIHAHIIAQYLDGRYYSELRGWQRGLFIAAVGVLGFGLSWLFWQRRMNFLSLGAATAALVVFDAAAYSVLRIVLPFTLALYVWFIAVTLGHHLRLIHGWGRSQK